MRKILRPATLADVQLQFMGHTLTAQHCADVWAERYGVAPINVYREMVMLEHWPVQFCRDAAEKMKKIEDALSPRKCDWNRRPRVVNMTPVAVDFGGDRLAIIDGRHRLYQALGDYAVLVLS